MESESIYEIMATSGQAKTRNRTMEKIAYLKQAAQRQTM